MCGKQNFKDINVYDATVEYKVHMDIYVSQHMLVALYAHILTINYLLVSMHVDSHILPVS